MDKSKTYYCPKCGKKKLVADSEYSDGRHNRIWRCLFNVPVRRRYGSNAKPPGTPCGVVIKADGRDAEIDDYDDVLAKLATINVPQVQQWMLQHQRNIHKKGLEVLYEGPLVDLVRCNDGDRVGAGLYWRGATWDGDSGLLNPIEGKHNALRCESAHYVKFRNFACSTLFAHNGAAIWEPNEDKDAVFSGKTVGKRLKDKLARFVVSLEKEVPGLIEQCKSEQQRWSDERSRYEERLAAVLGNVGGLWVNHYSGESKRALINIRQVRPAEAKAIGELLGFEVKLNVLSVSPHAVSPETASEIERVVGQPLTVDIARYFGRHYGNDSSPERRLSMDEALGVARILATTCPS